MVKSERKQEQKTEILFFWGRYVYFQHNHTNITKINAWYITTSNYAGGYKKSQWLILLVAVILVMHDDVINWKHFPRYWPFVRGIHRSPVNSPHKGQWRGALMFPLICARINGWVNSGEAGDMRRYRAYYDVTVMNVVLQSVRATAPTPISCGLWEKCG